MRHYRRHLMQIASIGIDRTDSFINPALLALHAA